MIYIYYDYIFEYIYGYLILCVVHVHIYIYTYINIYIYMGLCQTPQQNQRHCLWEIPRHCRDVNPSGEGSLRRWKDKFTPRKINGFQPEDTPLEEVIVQTIIFRFYVHLRGWKKWQRHGFCSKKMTLKGMPTIITWPRSLKIWQLAPKNAGNPIGISFSRGLFSGGYVGFLEGKLYIYIYIPSCELTYPLLKALLSRWFPFSPRWDMLVPWKIYMVKL